MKIKYDNISAIGNNQQGAVLIVVLLFLVLITLAGVMSARNSSTDLKIATSDQINTVLLQSADNVNSKLEQVVNGPTTEGGLYQRIVSEPVGILAHFLNSPGSSKDILSTCYRPRGDNFSKRTATINRSGGTLIDNNGYCDPAKQADYTGDRGTTMTQLMLNQVEGSDAYPQAFDGMVLGVNASSKSATKAQFDFHTTSVLPAFGTADSSEIADCFEEAGNVDKKAMLTCMRDNDIVAKQIIERVEIGTKTITDTCMLYGGAAGTSISSLCSKNP